MIKMTSSVAMATYNGSKFIIEQLDSIINQIRKPDEIIICDDNSTDNTIQSISEYISKKNIRNIRIISNPTNIGFKKNFCKAISLCKADIIFFSDQDDIWHPDKIKLVMDQFEKRASNISGILCNFSLIESSSQISSNNKKGYTFLGSNFDILPFNYISKYFNCGGLNLAIKREIAHQIYPYLLQNDLAHDVPIGLILSSNNSLYYLDKTLVYHRVHDNNVTKPTSTYCALSRLQNVERHLKSARVKLSWLIGCKNMLYDNLSDIQKSWYDSEITFYTSTIEAINTRNILNAIKLIFINNPLINKKFAYFTVLAILKLKLNKNE